MNDRFKFRYVFEKDFGGKTGICYKMPVFNLDDAVRSVFENKIIEYTNFDYKLIAKNQCTGMKDKNGKLIYEGDFLKDDENLLYEVIFKLQEYATSFSLKRREIPDYYPHITTWCGLGYRNCNKYEVVGNIYENEELIDESKK
jgi:uncharacterized phage protein (TIGR01671 family)